MRFWRLTTTVPDFRRITTKKTTPMHHAKRAPNPNCVESLPSYHLPSLKWPDLSKSGTAVEPRDQSTLGVISMRRKGERCTSSCNKSRCAFSTVTLPISISYDSITESLKESSNTNIFAFSRPTVPICPIGVFRKSKCTESWSISNQRTLAFANSIGEMVSETVIVSP